MHKRIVLICVILALVLVIGGAGALYNHFSTWVEAPELEPENLPDKAVGGKPVSAAQAQTQAQVIQAPDFTVYDAAGKPVRLSDFLGTPVVLNFWASWCGPCQMEMPDFQAAYERYGQDVAFVMVNMTDGMRETMRSAAKFLVQTGYTMPVYYDTDTHAAWAYSVYSLPSTYFIDEEGHILSRKIGMIDAAGLEQGIQKILN